MDSPSIIICNLSDNEEFEFNYLSQDYSLIYVKNANNCLKQIKNGNISVIMLNSDNLSKSKELLSEIHNISPITRKILIDNNHSKTDVLGLLNEKLINHVLDTSISKKEMLKALEQNIKDYQDEKSKKMKSDELITSSTMINTLSDNFVELTLKLSEFEHIEDFTNQFIKILDGLISLVRLNANLYLKDHEQIAKDEMYKFLSDIEVFANQYDQKILTLYIHLLRASLELETENLENAVNYYKSAIRVFYWMSTEYLDRKLIDIIQSFPVYEDDLYYHRKENKPFTLDQEMKGKVDENLNILLGMDMSKLVNVTENLVKPMGIDYQPLQSLLIARDSLPVYVKDLSEDNIDFSLISGFVEALSNFIQEVVKGRGDIENISHDAGVILIHKIEKWKFIIMANSDDAHLRIGLRQFAHETIDLVKSIPFNQFADDDIESHLDKTFEKLFIRKK